MLKLSLSSLYLEINYEIKMSKNLLSRLDNGPVIFAEGYLFAMERRGYLSAGSFVPEVVLEHPEVVSQLHREFIRSGSARSNIILI